MPLAFRLCFMLIIKKVVMRHMTVRCCMNFVFAYFTYLLNRCPSRHRRPSRPRRLLRQQALECRSSGPSLRSLAPSPRGATRWRSNSSSGTRLRWTRTKLVASCSDNSRTCSEHGRTNANSCYRDSRISARRSATRSKNCETAMLL